jgi:hypothetical protein
MTDDLKRWFLNIERSFSFKSCLADEELAAQKGQL